MPVSGIVKKTGSHSLHFFTVTNNTNLTDACSFCFCNFAIGILLSYFTTIVGIVFRSRSYSVFDGSGSDSGSDQTVSTPAAPVPAPHLCLSV